MVILGMGPIHSIRSYLGAGSAPDTDKTVQNGKGLFNKR